MCTAVQTMYYLQASLSPRTHERSRCRSPTMVWSFQDPLTSKLLRLEMQKFARATQQILFGFRRRGTPRGVYPFFCRSLPSPICEIHRKTGLPKTIYSVNGWNFAGASHKLLKEHNEFLRNTEKNLQEKYAGHGFNWIHTATCAPHG